jgi:branched-chain amino acid transport system permease protein
MAYYLFVSLKTWGGDDGLPLAGRNDPGFGISLRDDAGFYYVVLACLVAALLLVGRLVHSRFGRVIQGIRENETRMEAIGYPVFGYKLACFVIGGALAGLAGALLVNQTGLASPNQLMWTQSGMLLVMVVVGGVGSLYGGALGAAALLILEEVLAAYTIHWQLGVGAVLLAIVFLAPRGLAGLAGAIARKRHG